MPICTHRTGQGRVCKSDIVEQHIDEFVSFHHKERTIIGSCRTCRNWDAGYKETTKKIKALDLVPPAELSLEIRQMIRDLRIKE